MIRIVLAKRGITLEVESSADLKIVLDVLLFDLGEKVMFGTAGRWGVLRKRGAGRPMSINHRARWGLIHPLLREGLTIRAIADRLGIGRSKVWATLAHMRRTHPNPPETVTPGAERA